MQAKALQKELDFVKERAHESEESRRSAEAKAEAMAAKISALENEMHASLFRDIVSIHAV